MRLLSIVAFAAALSLTACGKGEQQAPAAGGPAAGGAAAAQSGTAVTGMVIAETPTQLAAGATLHVRLLDVTRAEGEAIAVAEKTIPVSAIPAEFSIPYNQADINSIRTYAVEANIMDQGVARFVSQGRVGALTQGKPSRVTVRLAEAMVAPAPKDPVAELNTAYTEFEAQLGGLKRVTGSRIEGEEAAYAWDAFGDATGVRVVRETVNNAEGATVSQSKYAFDEAGKPWIIEREAGGAKTRVGWAPDGSVLIKEKNGAAAEIDQAEIDKLVAAADAAKADAAKKL